MQDTGHAVYADRKRVLYEEINQCPSTEKC